MNEAKLKEEIIQLNQKVNELEQRIVKLESSSNNTIYTSSEHTHATSAVTINSDGVTVFHRVISGCRIEQQCQFILLLMYHFKREGRSDMTSNSISKAIFRSGVPTQEIRSAFYKLRKSGLINSKPNQKIIFITPDGERESNRLENTLPVKT